MTEMVSMDPFSFLLYALAVWRIATLLVNEDGPFDIFVRMRTLIGVYAPPIPSRWGGYGLLRGMFSCVWCMSLWVAGGMILATMYLFPAAYWIAIIFSLSAVASLIDTLIDKG